MYQDPAFYEDYDDTHCYCPRDEDGYRIGVASKCAVHEDEPRDEDEPTEPQMPEPALLIEIAPGNITAVAPEDERLLA